MSAADELRVGLLYRRLRSQAQPRASVSSPSTPFSLAWWLTTLVVFLFLFVPAGGARGFGIIAVCGLFILEDVPRALSGLLASAPLLAYPALALASIAWSSIPAVTGKQGAELLLTFICSIIIAVRARGIGLVSAVMIACLANGLLVLVAQPSALKGVPLASYMGSKNQVAMAAHILLTSGLTLLVGARRSGHLRPLAVASVLVGVVELALARSAGGYIAGVVSVALIISIIPLRKIGAPGRIMLLLAGLVLAVPFVLAGTELLSTIDFVRERVLHKDTTLTGRTELWRIARTLIDERPALGGGYAAFWQQGNLDAEGIWQRYFIASRMGFNFHSQFLDIAVDLGLVGALIWSITLFSVAGAALLGLVRNASPVAAFSVSVLAALYIRLPVESTLIGPWNTYTFIFLVIAVQSLGRLRSGGADLRHSRAQMEENMTGVDGTPRLSARLHAS